MAVIEIPRANDHRITFSLSSGATDVTNVYFTLKERGDIAQNDTDAVTTKNCSFTIMGDTLAGYVDLDHDDTDISENYYKYDFKLKYANGSLVNTNSGFIRITPRVTVREA